MWWGIESSRGPSELQKVETDSVRRANRAGELGLQVGRKEVVVERERKMGAGGVRIKGLAGPVALFLAGRRLFAVARISTAPRASQPALLCNKGRRRSEILFYCGLTTKSQRIIIIVRSFSGVSLPHTLCSAEPGKMGKIRASPTNHGRIITTII